MSGKFPLLSALFKPNTRTSRANRSASLSRVTAVHRQVHTRDVARGFAQQKHDRATQVLVVGHAPEHRPLRVSGQKRLWLVTEETAGRDAINPDPLLTENARI